MVKVESLTEFTLQQFNQLKNIARKGKEEKGRLFKGDTFECSEEMAKYLTGENSLNKTVVKVIEVIPEKTDKPVKKATTNKSTATKKRTTKKEEK